MPKPQGDKTQRTVYSKCTELRDALVENIRDAKPGQLNDEFILDTVHTIMQLNKLKAYW